MFLEVADTVLVTIFVFFFAASTRHTANYTNLVVSVNASRPRPFLEAILPGFGSIPSTFFSPRCVTWCTYLAEPVFLPVINRRQTKLMSRFSWLHQVGFLVCRSGGAILIQFQFHFY